MSKYSLLFSVSGFFLLFFLSYSFILSANETPVKKKVKDPTQIKFTHRMSKAAKDLQWSDIYYQSYKKNKEINYLKLAARHCKSAIRLLFETQSLLSRTTRFYNQADKKRLLACKYFKMLRQKSFLLSKEHHLRDINKKCVP